MRVLDYLQRKGIDYRIEKRPTGAEAVANCPLCGDREQHFAINIETGAFNCKRKNHCGEEGSFYRLQKLLGDTPVQHNNETLIRRKRKPEYKKPEEIPTPTPAKGRVVEYLKSRNITESTIERFGIGESDKGAIMFPLVKDGVTVGIKYRTLDKKIWSEKGGEPVLFGRDNIPSDFLVICEGEIDCLSLYEYGILSVSVPSGTGDMRWIEHEWEWLERFKAIYLVMDMDEAGREAQEAIAGRLGKWRCYQVGLPFKDPNECLTKGVPREEIQECFESASSYNLETLVNPGHYADDVVKLMLDPESLDGLKTCFKSLNEVLRGWRPGELTVWSGANGSGKTTVLNQAMMHLMVIHQQKVCIASMEMLPTRLLRWMLIQGEIPPDELKIREALKDLDESLFLVNIQGSAKPEILLDTMEFAHRKYGINHFVIDSLMRIEIRGNHELQEQTAFVDRLVAFANRYKCHIHLVAHPRKGQSDKEVPDKVDISGTSNIVNLAHNVLVMHRIVEDEKEAFRKKAGFSADAVLYVRKNREHGDLGKTHLQFIKVDKRFREIDAKHHNPLRREEEDEGILI